MKAVRIIIALVVIIGAVVYYLKFSEKKAVILAVNAANKAVASKDYKEAVRQIDIALEKGRKYEGLKQSISDAAARAYAGYGKGFVESKDYEKAFEAFEKVPEFSESIADEERVCFYLGYCLANMAVTRKNTEQAVKYLEEAFNKNSNDIEVKLWLSRCKSRMVGIPLNKAALSAYENGEYEKAEGAFQKLAGDYKLIVASGATPWYYLSLIASEKGDGKKALEYLQKSVKEQGRLSGMKQKHEVVFESLKKKFPDLFADGNPEFDKLIE